MCGIFAYLNYLTPKTRKEIIDYLITGLQRLEYRGYDSAGRLLFKKLIFFRNLEFSEIIIESFSPKHHEAGSTFSKNII